jgi:GNAT superfamily N-acetyltransferase
VAESAWSRRDFAGKWRRLSARDPFWRPPQQATLRRTLGELKPLCLWLEALSRDHTFRGSSFETPVATAAVRRDPHFHDTGYLTLLNFINDRATLRALLESLAETLRPQGVKTLIGPTHLLPGLGGGALGSYWHLPPPPDTPYGPPYAPEHLDALMSPLETLNLLHFGTAQEVRGVAQVGLGPLEPGRLAGDLLPLLQAASASSPALSPPDTAEARALLRWLKPYRPFGFSAHLPGAPDTPVGFAFLYGDRSGAFNLAAPRRKRRSRTGRLWGGVLPAFRRQGVGRALLGAALEAARVSGWDSVSIGPVSQRGDAEAFLQACGGVRQQRYTLYRTGF